MSTTNITIVRHGETEWNVKMKLQGHCDSSLTKKGVKQAELLAKTIKNRKFDKFISSDLGRAVHTSTIINEGIGLTINKDSEIRERAFGVMEGLYLNEVEAKYPDVHEAYITRDSKFPIPEGESLVAFNKRIITRFNEIANENLNKELLIVAHGGVLDCIIRNIFGIKLDDSRTFSVFNSSVNKISVESGKWILHEWGNIDHLNNAKVLDEL